MKNIYDFIVKRQHNPYIKLPNEMLWKIIFIQIKNQNKIKLNKQIQNIVIYYDIRVYETDIQSTDMESKVN